MLPTHALVLDFENVLYIDSSGADGLADLVRSCRKHGVALLLCGVAHQPRDILQRCGLLDKLPAGHLCPTLNLALEVAVHGIK